MADEATWTGDSKYWPPDVKAAGDVIKRWLRARKRSAKLTTEMFMTLGSNGQVDIHFKSLDEIYDEGRMAGPSKVHVDPDSVVQY